MIKRNRVLLTATLFVLTMILGCTTQAEPNEQPEVATSNVVIVDDDLISASAKIVASKYANLSFIVGSQQVTVLVRAGDKVNAGDRLAVLSDNALPQNIILAESELIGARRVLSDLQKSQVAGALAEKAKVQAEIDLKDARYQLDSIKTGRTSDNIVQKVQAQLDLAEEDLINAEKEYEKVKNKKDGDLSKALATINLSDARIRVNDLTRQLNWYIGTTDPLEIAKREAAVAVAEATYDDALREYERLKEGPDPDEVLAAQARVQAYESVINQKYIIAPFEGTIIELYSQTGEPVSPGVPVILLADLSTLIVQTTDLSEIDVAKIQIGDVVKVTFDALANTSIPGNVSAISLKNAAGSGVYYTVSIELDETPRELRWGMSAFVEITFSD